MEAPARLPPLSALRAFEAAARLGSFSLAATELFVTHGAVSHQIRGLEAQLGFPLFVREGRGVRLTPAGQELAERTNAAFCEIGRTVAMLRQRANPRRLTVTTMPSFAARWLAPRIGQFIEQHPDVELNIITTNAILDFARDGVDIAVRFGLGQCPPDETATRLLEDELMVVASPALLAGRTPGSPRELKAFPLLRADGEYWKPWFARVGLDWEEPTTGLFFSDSSLILQAAVEGRGVALTRRRLCEREVAAGRLVQLFAETLASARAYWFVHPAEGVLTPLAQRFRDWIFAEAAAADPVTADPTDGIAMDAGRW
ncbi:transcriptional regulator GcvA [Niveibacterium sp. SC-1]|uniref:transcriptional regulator GcvA n=1 Tax=Niveibacterium sp. SC-1 TaxID=3135646 RepID=UPI00311EDADB